MKLSRIDLAILVAQAGQIAEVAELVKPIKPREPIFLNRSPIAFKDKKQDWQGQGKRRKARVK